MLLTNRAALEAIALLTLFKPSLSFRIPALAPKHGLIDELMRRQIDPLTTSTDTQATSTSTSSLTAPPTTYTYITPSPSASPIPITSQGEVVTTYVPILTLCPMTVSGAAIAPRIVQGPYANGTAPFKNVTANGCITELSASRTTVCDTTLKGVATQYHVTTCNQQITFSTLLGYSLSTIAPTDTSETGPIPTIETITTYFQAPWQSVTNGQMPTDVTQRVCSPVATSSQQCVDILEVWETIPISTVKTSTTHIDFTTTISGPSILSIETIHFDITDTLTEISISTILLHEYSTEHISTSTSTLGVITPASGSAITAARISATDAPETSTSTVTVYPAPGDSSSSEALSLTPVPQATIPETSTSLQAPTVTPTPQGASSTASLDDDTTVTSTTTLKITRTTFITGTTTMLMPSSTATTAPTSESVVEGVVVAMRRFFGT